MKTLILSALSLIFALPAYAEMGPRARAAFAQQRKAEAVQIIHSALSNPELRDQEVRAALQAIADQVARIGITIETPRLGKYCSGSMAYIASNRPHVIVFCPKIYKYHSPQYLIHELYHVMLGRISGQLWEECMADLVSSVAMITAVRPEDQAITSQPTDRDTYRWQCPETHKRQYKYHRTLEEQAASTAQYE